MLTICAIWMGSASVFGAVAEAAGRGGGVRDTTVNAPDTLVLDAYRAVVDLHPGRAEVTINARFTPTPRLVPTKAHRVSLNWPEGAGNAAWQGVTAEIDRPGLGVTKVETRVVLGGARGAGTRSPGKGSRSKAARGGRVHQVAVSLPALPAGEGRERSPFAVRLAYRLPIVQQGPVVTLPLRFLRVWAAPWSRIEVQVRLHGVRLAETRPAPKERLMDRLRWTVSGMPRADLTLQLQAPPRRAAGRRAAAAASAGRTGCCAVGASQGDVGLGGLLFGGLLLGLMRKRRGRAR
jgi:hypothetical protein